MKITKKTIKTKRPKAPKKSTARLVLSALLVLLAGYFFGKGRKISAAIFLFLGVSTYMEFPYFDALNAIVFGAHTLAFITMHTLNYFGVKGSLTKSLSKL